MVHRGSPQSSPHGAATFIAFYCSVTLVLLMFNKWFFTQHREFPFILTITWGQQVGVIILLLTFHTPLSKIMGPITHSISAFAAVAPVGMLAAMDYSFSNLALRIIPMTYYEIVKSCAPAVVLLISIALGLQRPSIKLIAIIAMIVCGATIAVNRDETPHGAPGAANHSTASHPAAANGSHKVAAPPVRKHHISEHKQHNTEHKQHNTKSTSSKEAHSTSHHKAAPGGAPHPPSELTFQGLTFIVVAAVVSGMKSVAAQLTLHGGRKPPRRASTTHRHSSIKIPSNSSKEELSNHSSFAKEGGHQHGSHGHGTHSNSKGLNPITVTYFSAWSIVLLLLPVAGYMEGKGLVRWYHTTSRRIQLEDGGLIFASSVLSILVSLSSFLVMRETSALTYAVVALGERVLIVVSAVWLLGETLPLYNASGFALTLTGIAWYNQMKLSPANPPEKKNSEETNSKDHTTLDPFSNGGPNYGAVENTTQNTAGVAPDVASPTSPVDDDKASHHATGIAAPPFTPSQVVIVSSKSDCDEFVLSPTSPNQPEGRKKTNTLHVCVTEPEATDAESASSQAFMKERYEKKFSLSTVPDVVPFMPSPSVMSPVSATEESEVEPETQNNDNDNCNSNTHNANKGKGGNRKKK